MSSFLGTTSGTAGVGIQQYADDKRLWPNGLLNCDTYKHLSIVEPFHHFGFQTDWWPARSSLDASGAEWLCAELQWGRPEFTSGAITKVVFTGVTRDVNGAILASCLVKLFKTAAGSYPGTKDQLLDETTSNPTTGAFTVMSPYYPDAHYLVSYRAGSPDVQGTTVNTLIGA